MRSPRVEPADQAPALGLAGRRAWEGLFRPEPGDHGLAGVPTARALQQRHARMPVLGHGVDRLEQAPASWAWPFDGARSEKSVLLRVHGRTSRPLFMATVMPGRQVRIG